MCLPSAERYRIRVGDPEAAAEPGLQKLNQSEQFLRIFDWSLTQEVILPHTDDF